MTKLRYIYDGSFDGFLSCVYHVYKSGDSVSEISSCDESASFLVELKKIETDKSLSEIVSNALIQKVSYDAYMQIYLAFLSDEKDREHLLLDYIRLAFKHGASIEHRLTKDCVIQVQRMSKKTSRERHRMLGLVRFQSYGSFLYAPIETSCYLLPILGTHFQKRMPNETFVIHDVKRNMALSCYKGILVLSPLTEDDLELDGREDFFVTLWKAYHTSLSIKERENPRLQIQNMPKKYWKHLTEMQK